ncbi:hypothetical protein BFJ71_g14335 [Fusarium oxysporum]|nr:hypothetical protein BFJ71_g14335 [Fusarium oxysporum]
MMPAATSDCQPFGLDVRRRKRLKIDLAFSGSSISKHFGSSSNGTFTEQIKAAIDAKFGRCGLPPSPSAVPLVDALLFPPPLDEHDFDVAGGMEYELPSRKQADYLVNTY